MHKLIIEISDETYDRMARQAKITNKTPVMLIKDLLQVTYGNGLLHSTNGHSPEASRMNDDTEHVPKTARKVLEEEGMVVTLSDELQALTMPEVTIDVIIQRLLEISRIEHCLMRLSHGWAGTRECLLYAERLPIDTVQDILARTKELLSHMNGDTKAASKTIDEILEAEGMLEPQEDDPSEFAMPDIISIETARNILAKAGGPSLTEILDEQRGPRF